MVFNVYSKYYDLLNRDKDYSKETTYIDNLLKKYAQRETNSLIDVGCGTGKHDIVFANKGYDVWGIDRAVEMIDIANCQKGSLQNVSFQVGDATNFNLDMGVDAVVSLFHVMSYLNDSDVLSAAFKNIYNHLNKDGLFIFDFWHGPAVLTDKPEQRLKKMEDNDLIVYRVATPVLYAERNVVDVNYEIHIIDKQTQKTETIKEMHSMRYLFLPELEYMLKNIGFKIVTSLEWLHDKKIPDFSSWNACMVVQK